MSREKPTVRQKYLSDTELRRLFTAAPPNAHDLLFVAANLGLRVGEVVRLQIEKIRDDGTIMVPCLKRGKTGQRIKRNELPKEYETLPLLPDVRAALDRQIGARKTGWIFASPRDLNQHITERYAEMCFVAAREKAKLDTAYSFHSLRHSYGTRVYAETQDVLAVQSLLRHRDWKSSMVYAHMTDAARQKIADRVGTIGKEKANGRKMHD